VGRAVVVDAPSVWSARVGHHIPGGRVLPLSHPSGDHADRLDRALGLLDQEASDIVCDNVTILVSDALSIYAHATTASPNSSPNFSSDRPNSAQRSPQRSASSPRPDTAPHSTASATSRQSRPSSARAEHQRSCTTPTLPPSSPHNTNGDTAVAKQTSDIKPPESLAALSTMKDPGQRQRECEAASSEVQDHRRTAAERAQVGSGMLWVRQHFPATASYVALKTYGFPFSD
jgi:hypothetical protein